MISPNTYEDIEKQIRRKKAKLITAYMIWLLNSSNYASYGYMIDPKFDHNDHKMVIQKVVVVLTSSLGLEGSKNNHWIMPAKAKRIRNTCS